VSEHPRITKEKSKVYAKVYKTDLQTNFYFNKDGTFDGIGIDVRGTTKEEKRLVEELCRELAETLRKD